MSDEEKRYLNAETGVEFSLITLPPQYTPADKCRMEILEE